MLSFVLFIESQNTILKNTKNVSSMYKSSNHIIYNNLCEKNSRNFFKISPILAQIAFLGVVEQNNLVRYRLKNIIIN